MDRYVILLYDLPDKLLANTLMFISVTEAFHCPYSSQYIQQQKKRENLLLLSWLKINYVEFKKYILHVKLTV